MIIKTNRLSEAEILKAIEFEDRMHKMGHSQFHMICNHTSTEDRPNPEGPYMRTFCKVCGEEII